MANSRRRFGEHSGPGSHMEWVQVGPREHDELHNLTGIWSNEATNWVKALGSREAAKDAVLPHAKPGVSRDRVEAAFNRAVPMNL